MSCELRGMSYELRVTSYDFGGFATADNWGVIEDSRSQNRVINFESFTSRRKYSQLVTRNL
jgi:hypothetical protein